MKNGKIVAIVFAIGLFSIAQVAEAGVFNRLNRLRGRWFSDGIHRKSPQLYQPHDLIRPGQYTPRHKQNAMPKPATQKMIPQPQKMVPQPQKVKPTSPSDLNRTSVFRNN